MADVIAHLPAMSIREFCRLHGFSKSHFYKLKKKGLAPRTLHVGSKQIVTDEYRREWLERMKALETDGDVK